MRTYTAAAFIMLLLISPTRASAAEYELTEEEAKFVRSILQRDELLRSLPKAQKGLDALNTLLAAVPAGPIKLALTWNQTAIKTWRVANKKLDKIGKATICDEIQLRTEGGTKNVKFFEQLSKSRGCGEDPT